MVELQLEVPGAAADLQQLGPSARDLDAVSPVVILIAGVLTRALANEPAVLWEGGLFSSRFRS